MMASVMPSAGNALLGSFEAFLAVALVFSRDRRGNFYTLSSTVAVAGQSRYAHRGRGRKWSAIA
jgi:hypothetical protein